MANGSAPSLGTIKGTIKIDYDGAGVVKAETDLDKVGKKSGDTKKAMDKLALGSAIAGGVVAGGFALAVKSAADFEEKLSGIKAVSGATTNEMEQIRQKALQLGKDTQFSASEAASAISELSKAGVSTKDILSGAADATVALAAAGGVALPEAATIAANAMNGFGLAAKDLPRVADLIAGAANASAIDVSDFGQSLQQAAAVAHLAGISFDDTAVAIAEMGNAGIKGSDAGTSLKTFLQNLIPTTKQQIELSKKLGLITKDGGNAFFDASGKAKSLADISQILQNSLKGMGKEQQLATLQTLFGSDAIRAAAILADNGAAGFNNLAGSMNKVKAADVAKTRMDNLNGSMEQFKGSVETVGIQIGTIALPALKKLVDHVGQLVNWFANLAPHTQKIVVEVIAAAGGFALLTAAVIKFVQLVKTIQEVAAIIKAWTIWTKIAAAATKVWTAAQWLLNVAMDANPVILIVLAVIVLIGIIVLLWIKCAAFRNFFIGIWNHIWSFMKTIGAWFAGPFAGFFVSLWGKISEIWNKIWSFLKVIGAWFAGPFANFFVTLWQKIVTVFNAIWGFIKSIVSFWAPLFKAVFGAIIAIAQLWWSVFTAIWATVFAVIKAILTPLINFIVGAWKWAFGLVIQATQLWWSVLTAFWKAIYNFLAPIVMGVVNFVVGAWKWLFDTVVGAARLWWSVFSAVWSAIYNFVAPIISTVVNFIVGAWNLLFDTIKKVAETWWSVFSGFWTGVWNAFGTVVNTVINFIGGVINKGVAFITNVINGFTTIINKIKGFFDGLRNAANGGVEQLIKYVGAIPGRIVDALAGIGSALYGKGRDLIQGLINGFSSMAGRIRDALVGLLPGPLKKFAGLLGLASPSKLFKKWGAFTVQGFINGVDTMRQRLMAAISSVAGFVTSPVVTTGAVGNGASTVNSAAAIAAGRGSTVNNNAGPTYVTLAVDGRELGQAAVLDPVKTATAAQTGTTRKAWGSTPSRVGAGV